MSRSSPNWTVIRVLPSELCDVISVTGDLAEMPLQRRRDIGRHVVGAGARMFAWTETVAKSICGSGETGDCPNASQPANAMPTSGTASWRHRPANEKFGEPIVHVPSVATTPLAAPKPKPPPIRSKKEIDHQHRRGRRPAPELG